MLLITGITGKSGRFLWDELNQHIESVQEEFSKGIRLAVHKRKQDDMFVHSALKFELCQGDLADPAYLETLTQDVHTILHIAGIHSSLPFVRIALKNGVKRLILVHTTGIYSKYKMAGEAYRQIDAEIYRLAKEYDASLTILRPTMIYGTIHDANIAVFIKMIDKLRIMPIVDQAKYELQPVHCKDLGKAYYQVLMHPDETKNKDYNLSGGAPISLKNIFQEIAENLGVKRSYLNVPYPIAYGGAWLLYLISFDKFDFREKVQRLCETRTFSHEEAARDFGYAPMTFPEGIREEVSMYMKSRG